MQLYFFKYLILYNYNRLHSSKKLVECLIKTLINKTFLAFINYSLLYVWLKMLANKRLD